MIKKTIIKRISIIICIIFTILIISIFPKNKSEFNIISKETGVLYLIDNNNYVSKVNYYYKATNTIDNVKEIIDILTINSPYEIRDGFNKIIPENTKLINASLLDKTLTLNFSKELLNISEDKELPLIEALVYSLTSLKEIENITIKVENVILKNLPNSKKELPELLNSSLNINKLFDINSIKNINQTIIYYIASLNDYEYIVPVTKYTNDNNKIEIIISELKSHTTYNTNIIDYINDIELVNYEINDNNIIVNLSSLNNTILESVKYALNESISKTYNMPVVIYLNNKIVV